MGICEISAPQVDTDNAFTCADFSIERTVKALVDVVCLCPKDFPRTSILGGSTDLINPTAM